MSTEAIILAAGRGRRMGALSDDCHKALLPVGGMSIIARLAGQLLQLDASVIHVVTGYRAAEVEQHLRDVFPRADLRFAPNPRFAETNNVVSLALGLERVTPGSDVVLAECDLVPAPGLLAPLDGRTGNVAVVSRHAAGMDGTVVRLRDGVVAEIIPAARQDAAFRFADTYKTLNAYRFSGRFCEEVLHPRVRAEADAGAYYEAVLATLPDLEIHRLEAAVVPAGAWTEVDDPGDLAAARRRFAEG